MPAWRFFGHVGHRGAVHQLVYLFLRSLSSNALFFLGTEVAQSRKLGIALLSLRESTSWIYSMILDNWVLRITFSDRIAVIHCPTHVFMCDWLVNYYIWRSMILNISHEASVASQFMHAPQTKHLRTDYTKAHEEIPGCDMLHANHDHHDIGISRNVE